MSPLHCACWKGQTEAVEFLLSNGAQIAESDTSLKTALHWSVQFGHFETLLTLLKVPHLQGWEAELAWLLDPLTAMTQLPLLLSPFCPSPC